MEIALRPAVAADLDWLVELRAVVLREDLERLGRYDEIRVRERMRAAFDATLAQVIVVDGHDAGSISLRADDGTWWLEHFYLAPDLQGRGVGGAVLRQVLSEDPARELRLNVLQGSSARRLYERHGFVQDSADAIDVWMTRPASSSV